MKDATKINYENISKERETLHEWHTDGNSVGRFVAGLYAKKEAAGIYAGTGAHGFNWFGSSKSKCFDDVKNRTGVPSRSHDRLLAYGLYFYEVVY